MFAPANTALTSVKHEGKQPQVLEESVTDADGGSPHELTPSPLAGQAQRRTAEGWPEGRAPQGRVMDWGEGKSPQASGEAGFTQGYRNTFTATPWNIIHRPQPQHPGWLASAPQLSLSELAAHWQDRILSEQNDARALYRFQDNRVIGHHLRSLVNQQLPLLLGPLHSKLCWHQAAWLIVDNPAPGFQPPPFDRPWLDVAELSTVQHGILFHNLQQWLWEEHPESTARLASTEPLAAWLTSQLRAAEVWGWQEPEQLRFLLRHKLEPQSAHDAVWAPNDGETPAEHYRRCYGALRSRTYS